MTMSTIETLLAHHEVLLSVARLRLMGREFEEIDRLVFGIDDQQGAKSRRMLAELQSRLKRE